MVAKRRSAGSALAPYHYDAGPCLLVNRRPNPDRIRAKTPENPRLAKRLPFTAGSPFAILAQRKVGA